MNYLRKEKPNLSRRFNWKEKSYSTMDIKRGYKLGLLEQENFPSLFFKEKWQHYRIKILEYLFYYFQVN
jgi:hypothetical protein